MHALLTCMQGLYRASVPLWPALEETMMVGEGGGEEEEREEEGVGMPAQDLAEDAERDAREAAAAMLVRGRYEGLGCT